MRDHRNKNAHGPPATLMSPKASCKGPGMGDRTLLSQNPPKRDLGRALVVALGLAICACKSGPAEPVKQPSPKRAPAKAQPPSATPVTPIQEAEPQPSALIPKTSAKKAPPGGQAYTRAGQAYVRAGSIGDLAFVERIFEPPGPRTKKDLPVLVMIHGLGDRADNFLHLTDSLHTPHRALSLQGLNPYNGSFGNGFAWFQTRVRAGQDKKLAAEIDHAAAAVAKGLRALNQKEDKLGRKFVVTGFSQGGILSYALAVQYPELIATAVPISGLLPTASRRPKDKKRTKVVAFHGEADEIVPFARGRELGQWLRGQGFDYELQSFPEVGHRIPAPMANPLLHTLDRILDQTISP